MTAGVASEDCGRSAGDFAASSERGISTSSADHTQGPGARCTLFRSTGLAEIPSMEHALETYWLPFVSDSLACNPARFCTNRRSAQKSAHHCVDLLRRWPYGSATRGGAMEPGRNE